MSIPMTPAEVAQASDSELLNYPLLYAWCTCGCRPAEGTDAAVVAEIEHRRLNRPPNGDLLFLFPNLCPDAALQGQAAGNMG